MERGPPGGVRPSRFPFGWRVFRESLGRSIRAFERSFPRTWTQLRRQKVLLWTAAIIGSAALIMNLLFGGNLAQVLMTGLVVGSIYVLGATGLSLLYGIKKFANFAHGDLLTLGTYMAFVVNVQLGAHLAFGLVFSLIVLAFVGIILELAVFRHLEGRGVVAPLVASVGVAIIIQNIIQAIWGGDVQAYIFPRERNWVTPWFEIHPIKGVLTLTVSVGAVALLHVLLSRTTLGKSMRAMSDNPDLARSSGISTGNVTLWTWVISCMLASLAGVLLGMALDVRPLLGSGILLFLFAAVIIGGISSPYGAMIGGFAVGVVQEMSGMVLEWLDRARVVDYPFLGALLVPLLVLGVLLGLGLLPALMRAARPASRPDSASMTERIVGSLASSWMVLAAVAYIAFSLGLAVVLLVSRAVTGSLMGGAIAGLTLITLLGLLVGLIMTVFPAAPFGWMARAFMGLHIILVLSALLLLSMHASGTTIARLEVASAYRPVAAFIVMIAVLLLKPEGLLGTPMRQATRTGLMRARPRRA